MHRGDEGLAAAHIAEEHVIAGAGRRQQHRIAGPARRMSRPHRLVHTCPRESGRSRCGQERGRSTGRHARSAQPPVRAVPPRRRAARTPVPCPRRRDQHHRPGHTVQRCDAGLDIGALGVVVERHAAHDRSFLEPVREPLEGPQRVEQRRLGRSIRAQAPVRQAHSPHRAGRRPAGLAGASGYARLVRAPARPHRCACPIAIHRPARRGRKSPAGDPATPWPCRDDRRG